MTVMTWWRKSWPSWRLRRSSVGAVRNTFFWWYQPIFFFWFQDSYRKGYLHDSRRENDQKNSYLNIDFENGNCVIKRWFYTRVSHDLSSWLKSWLSHEIKSWGTLSWPTVMTGHDQRHKSWLILTERAKTFKLVTIRHDRSWRRDQAWSWPLVMTKLVTWDLWYLYTQDQMHSMQSVNL